MKDPLQKQQTPYEILGVARGATVADIDKAFKLGLVKRVPVQKLTGAKVALERPVERAVLDLLHYDDDVLARLNAGPDALDPGRRADTANEWEGALRRAFPDYGIIHALAVLWYWEAMSLSEQCVESPSPKLEAAAAECWRNAVGFAAALVASDDFWKSQSYIPPDVLSKVQTALYERIAADIHRFAAAGKRFAEIELMWKNEVRVARSLAAADIRANRGRLACGVILLERMSLLEKIRGQVENALHVNPANTALVSLRDALSPFSAIAALIESKQYQLALDEIERLPERTRDSREVWKLEAIALLERGKQQASLDNLEAALGLWARGLTKATTEEAKKSIHDELVNTVQAKAAALQSKQPDEAIRILDRALKLVRSQKLELTLAEILTTRGVATILDAQKKVEQEKKAGPDVIKAVERGLADLERAAKLGSKRAEEQAGVARGILASLKGGVVAPSSSDLPSGVASLVNQAAAAAEKKEWSTAIDLLRRALDQCSYGSTAAKQIQKHLSMMLANRSVGAVNLVMTMMQNKDSKSAADLQLVVKVIETARKDLREAAQLDPDNAYARDNLREVEKMLEDLGPLAAFSGADVSGPFYAPPVPERKEGRHVVHGIFVGAFIVIAMMIALSNTKGLYETSASRWLDAQVIALRDGSPVGHAAYVMAKFIGWPAWLATFIMFFGSWFAVPGGYLYGVVCGTRWWKKDGFAKFLEVGLYAFAIAFIAGIAMRPAKVATPAPKTASVSPAKAAPPPVPKAASGAAGSQPAETKRRAESPPLHDFTRADAVVKTLQSIAGASKDEAKRQAESLASTVQTSSDAARSAILFCVGAAYERGGEAERAKSAYQQILASATPAYKRSAEFRLAALEASDAKLKEAKFRSLADQKPDEGVFYLAGQWTAADSKRAALQSLMDLRAGKTSIRLFNYLRSKSFFPPAYAYLFILLALAVAIKIVSLPFLVHGAKASLAIPRLRGEYARLKTQYAGDAVRFANAVQDLYRRHGIKPTAGCMKVAIDIGFVVWVMLTLRNYAPQLTLDGSKFLWVSNVVDRDIGVLVMWVLAGVIMLFLTPQIEQGQTAQLACASLAILGIIAGAAWYWSWPAYLMIFWTVLSLFTAVVHFVTIGVLATRS